MHGDRFDYSFVDYQGARENVVVVCREHGPFSIRAGNHLSGQGCAKCSGKAKPELDDLIARFKKVHGEKYDYSLTRYVNANTKVQIICPEHGVFEQTSWHHLEGMGCPKCGVEKRSETRRLTQEEFESNMRVVFGEDRVDLSNAWYVDSQTNVWVRCIEHDRSFEATPNNLFAGNWNCPKCRHNGVSKGENAVADYLESLGFTVWQSKRDIIPPKELDIFIPEKNLAIEFNGVIFHSDKIKPKSYHRDKYLACKAKGVRLIQFTDVLWQTRQEQVMSLLANALGARADTRKVNARSCAVEEVEIGVLKDFYDQNHIQGHCRTGSLSLALFFEGEVVAAMVFGKGTNRRGSARIGREAEWTLSRYATSCIVRGGFQKLLKRGREIIGLDKDIISFSMNDYFQGGTYVASGFELDAEVEPDYQVYHQKIGLKPKSHWQRRNIPARLAEIGWEGGFDPETDPRTEWQVEDEVGCMRIFDAGKIRWRLRGVS